MAEPWTDAQFDAALEKASTGAIVARDVRLQASQLKQMIGRLQRPRDEPPRVWLLDLSNAVVEGRCDLDSIVVKGAASFRRTRFLDIASFDRSTFENGATFRDAEFEASASFTDAHFGGTWFHGATFADGADFSGSTWSDEATFDGVRFALGADFPDAEFATASFSGAEFEGAANFFATRFRYAEFDAATFTGDTSFDEANFAELCHFDAAAFEAAAHFRRCRFGGLASFADGAHFEGAATFERSTFGATAWFVDATFAGPTDFGRVAFSDLALFSNATFAGKTSFAGADLGADVDVAGARFAGDATFRRARFRDARRFGPMEVGGELSLEFATFDEIVRIETTAATIACDGAVFRAGVDLLASGASVTADGADFGAASLIGTPAATGERNLPSARRPDDGTRVLSLRNAKVAHLTLSCVDLHRCHFAGAHGLDALRLERVRFLKPPAGGRWRRWTRRDTIVEEHLWRVATDHGSDWGAGVEADTASADSERPEPTQVASIYRALRKGREDTKDEPGAGDFYYGEMEMRRHRLDAPYLERLTLTAYWLVSGYGMRPGRALAALLLTIAVLAIPLDLGGFSADRSYAGAVLYAVESSISLLRAPDEELTAGGEVVTIALRILGPLLFGLAALALRSRVKR